MANATAVKRAFELALELDRDEQKRRRAEEKGGEDRKENPYVSDQGKCNLQVYWSLRNMPQTNPPDLASLANFLVGHAVEDAYARIMERLGEVHREVKVSLLVTDYCSVDGRLDFLFIFPDLKTIVELKSTSSKAASWMLKREPGGKKDHRLQLQAYLAAGRAGALPLDPEHCESGCLVYVVKDAVKGQEVFHAFDVPFDEGSYQDSMASLAAIKRAALEGNEPAKPADYTRSKFPCSYCVYREGCWDGLWSKGTP